MRTAIIAQILILCMACSEREHAIEKEVVILLDETDSCIYRPHFDEFANHVIPKDIDNGISVRARKISDISFGSSFGCKLEPKGIAAETPEERYLVKKKFVKEVESRYMSFCESSHLRQKGHSIIYPVVCQELVRLSTSTALEKMMLVNSDLKENSEILNVYSPHGYNLVMNDRDSVKRLFTGHKPLPRLDGVKVYFTYVPVDFEENELYVELVSIYRELIEEAGGTCVIGPSEP